MSKLNRAAIVGFLCCFLMIITGVATNGGMKTIVNFLHIPSAIITFGGTFFAGMITSDSFHDYFDGLKAFFKAFQTEKVNLDEISSTIFELSSMSRKEGLLGLDVEIDKLDNDYLKKGIRLVVDGTDAELIRDILETEMIHEEAAKKSIHFWQDLGFYAPAWGMIGTLIGLINMMKQLQSNSSMIGDSMSLALITTLYGSLMANWICIPISRKLMKSCEQEQMVKELIIEGVLSIQAGENPHVVKEKIRTFRANWEEKNAA